MNDVLTEQKAVSNEDLLSMLKQIKEYFGPKLVECIPEDMDINLRRRLAMDAFCTGVRNAYVPSRKDCPLTNKLFDDIVALLKENL